jgi:large subunit ribosomal protein L30
MSPKLRVRLRKSPISYRQEARGTLRALGLRHINDIVEVADNPATRGMVRAVRFLVDVEEIGGRGHGRGRGSKAPAASVREPSEGAPGMPADPEPAAAGGEETA